MVKRSLDFAVLEKKLEKKRNRSLKTVALPKGITKARFDLFLKVMEAKSSSELKDVSIEDLATLFVDMEDLISVIHDDSVLKNPGALIRRLESMKSVRIRRRIL